MQCDEVNKGPIGGTPVHPLAPKPCRRQAKFHWKSPQGQMRHTCFRHTPTTVKLKGKARLSR